MAGEEAGRHREEWGGEETGGILRGEIVLETSSGGGRNS